MLGEDTSPESAWWRWRRCQGHFGWRSKWSKQGGCRYLKGICSLTICLDSPLQGTGPTLHRGSHSLGRWPRSCGFASAIDREEGFLEEPSHERKEAQLRSFASCNLSRRQWRLKDNDRDVMPWIWRGYQHQQYQWGYCFALGLLHRKRGNHSGSGWSNEDWEWLPDRWHATWQESTWDWHPGGHDEPGSSCQDGSP